MSNCAARFFVVPRHLENDLLAHLFHGGLDQVLLGLVSGEFVSVDIELDKSPNAERILVHHPNLGEDNFPYWLADVFVPRLHDLSMLEIAKAIVGMKFAALWHEDSPDLGQMGMLTKKNFPWGDWRLIAAAIAEEGGDIVNEEVRKGPAHTSLHLQG